MARQNEPGFARLDVVPRAWRAGFVANPFASSVNFITNTLRLPAPEVLASFVTLLESGGGLMLAAGLFTWLIAPMIAIEMAMSLRGAAIDIGKRVTASCGSFNN